MKPKAVASKAGSPKTVASKTVAAKVGASKPMFSKQTTSSKPGAKPTLSKSVSPAAAAGRVPAASPSRAPLGTPPGQPAPQEAETGKAAALQTARPSVATPVSLKHPKEPRPPLVPVGSVIDEAGILLPFQRAHSSQTLVSVGYEMMSLRLLDGGLTYYDRGIKPLLLALSGRTGLAPIIANHILVGIDHPDGVIGFGPGGQLRIDLPASDSVAKTAQHLRRQIELLMTVGASLGLTFSTVGFHPDRDPALVPIVTKQHYPIMVQRFKTSGTRGLSVLTSASQCSVKISVSSEADFVAKMRVGVALAPYLVAAFANSPMERGKLTGMASVRGASWLDVDRARTSLWLEVFDEKFSYERYARFGLAAPAFGLLRSGRAIDTQGRTFAECLVHPNDGITPVVDDWRYHLDTLYPAVRWNDGVELRCVDAGTPEHALCLMALWKGLLSTEQARKATLALLTPNGPSHARLLQKATRQGLFAVGDHGTIGRVLQKLATLAERFLPAEERRWLQPLHHALGLGMTPGDELSERFSSFSSTHQLLLAFRPSVDGWGDDFV